MRKLNYFITIALLIGLVGCSGKEEVANHDKLIPMHVHYIPKNDNPIEMSNKDSFYVSKPLVRDVEKLDIVEKAEVVILNQEAYVAIWTDINRSKNNDQQGKTGRAIKEGVNRALQLNDEKVKRRDTETRSNQKKYEKWIKNVILSQDPSIERVYISFHPEAYRRMKVFADTLVKNGNNDSLSGDFELMTNKFFEK